MPIFGQTDPKTAIVITERSTISHVYCWVMFFFLNLINKILFFSAPTEPLTKVVTDLRVQLHKKRQQQQKTTKKVEPEIVFEEALPEYESDVDSLENARVTSSDEEEIVQTTISRKKIGITSSGNSSSNRLVTKSGIKGSPRRVGFNQELPTKRLAIFYRF